jgi:2-keto-4-pentenoate hydratase
MTAAPTTPPWRRAPSSLQPTMPGTRALDLAAVQGVARINGAVVGEGLGADSMGHPLAALQWIANHLSSRGQALRRGDIVICGSLVASKFPGAGNLLRFEAGPLGAVELQVT